MTFLLPKRPLGLAVAMLALAGLCAAQAAPAQVIGPVTPVGPLCMLTPSPVPTGVTATPNPPFPANDCIFGSGVNGDHCFIHSSTHLQGLRSHEKWAGGLLYTPPGSSGFQGFTSAVVVDNPDPAFTLAVQIDYFDHNGALVGTSVPPPINPEGTHIEAAMPLAGSLGVGSARVTVTGCSGPTSDCPGLVGAVLLHTRCLYGTFCDTEPPFPYPGMSSMQQLQVVQDAKTELWWGPLPLTTVSPVDFFNSEAPFLWVVNPNNAPNQIRVDLVAYDRVAGTSIPFTWRNITLPPFGTLLEKTGPHLVTAPLAGLWDQFITWYGTLGANDFDILVHVTSESGLPILGDGVMTDVYGDDMTIDPPTQVFGKRFRMASHMLANTPNWQLIDPDFSYDPNGIIQTEIGVWNTGAADAGPLRIEYYNRNGVLVSTGNIPSLPPNRSVRIHPGVFGYPAVQVGYGWARISGCTTGAKLVGWTVREILETPGNEPHYHKAFGEILDGNNALEPGRGFRVTDANGNEWVRKVAPIQRADPSWYWPGYVTFANTAVANVGQYWFRFYDPAGTAGAACTNPAGQPFAGVRWANTSTTLVDPQTFCFGNQSGRVDITTGFVRGIDVIGDPFYEWGIPGFGLFTSPEE
ncbi:MAG TPA: hypothetical protein VLT87_08755 [Thermoanaerobaculia bacterium]|nr:hypothetical protein [Thermoanaerobaculia bacterium]